VPKILRTDVLAAKNGVLNEAASSQEVTSESITLAFEFCLVDIGRPWISGELLSLKNWYLSGYRKGDMASDTGVENRPFEFLTASAIVVRNLKIKADWSQENRKALEAGLAFGPFSLQGRTSIKETGERIRPGMQIVGWILEPMPELAPASDPGLASVANGPPV
jgi:hypothetical protein